MKFAKTIFIPLFMLGSLAIQGSAADEAITEPATPKFKRTLGAGFAYTGGLIRWGFKKVWSLEGRALFGSADSENGSVSSQVFGMRAYRHFRTERSLQLYVGTEMDYASAKSQNLKSEGYLSGGFAGLEYYILPRLSIGLDLGPYYVSVKEQSLSAAENGLDFILNTNLNFYLF